MWYRPGPLRTWVVSWIDLAGSVVSIATLGYYYPSWSFYFLAKAELKYLEWEKSR